MVVPSQRRTVLLTRSMVWASGSLVTSLIRNSPLTYGLTANGFPPDVSRLHLIHCCSATKCFGSLSAGGQPERFHRTILR